uniref:HTH psq-type domain-containing protein n=1 Tax=Glossina pallidipes TaxID=7398 RepID=A0A1B0A251_GLOPL
MLRTCNAVRIRYNSDNNKRSARSTPVPSTRRIYSEDDLNNALHEILSGRLGTRKAAVQYNVPRSTLRNKIYKLTMEARRNNEQTPPELLQLQQELEKDLSGDEDEISNSSTPQTEELATRIATPVMLRKLQCPSNVDNDLGGNSDEPRRTHISPKPAHLDSSKPQTSDILPEPSPQPPQIPAIDTNTSALLLQTLLLSDKNLRDLFSALLLNSTINLKDILLGATTAAANNSAASSENNNLSSSSQAANTPDYRPLLQLLLQQQQQQQVQQQQQQVNTLQTQYGVNRCVPKSETPETSSSLDPNEICDDPSAILKIPSYTPVAGTSSTLGASSSRGSVSPALLCNNSNSNSNTNRNGDSPGPLLLAAAVNAAKNQLSSNSLSVTPPLLHSGVESQSPQSLRMCDVIANSIHRTMNEQASKDVHAAAVSMLGLGPDSERQNVSDYKKPTISVVKNIGGTDTSRFGSAPNLLAAAAAAGHNSHHHHQPPPHLQHGHHTAAHHLSRQEAAALAAGKGTRPKRGKYRNYDRDSLVEAVKAVQRGEMSVHRAGSYYGVPHSTLEYKVKERHLMRPRKREPKPQPGLDGTSSSSSTKTNTNIPTGLNSLDKLKAGTSGNANVKLSGALKSNGTPGTSVFSSNTGNGMKLPIFDPALAHLSYAPHLFWQHPQAAAFSQLQMDFNRNSTVAPSSSSPTESSSNILKTHMHRYQDTANAVGNVPVGGAGVGNTTTNSSNAPSPIASPLSGQDINRARELYESSAANGASFLDGIIRKTLDRKSGDITTSPGSASGVLLDQLLMKKTPMPFTNNRGNEYNNISPSGSGPIKRSGSSLSLTATNIKRERTSPHSGSEDDDTSQSGNDESYETNNNNNKSIKAALENQRSRLGSRDSASETDTSSLKSEIQHNNSGHHLLNSSSNSKLPDLNGGSTIAVKTEIPALETGTSILQEKLSQIKAEQAEADENL